MQRANVTVEQTLLSEILGELRRQHNADDMWTADEIADFLKLSKKTVQNRILDDKTFPRSRTLPTGGRRWVAKEVIEWVKKRV